MAQQGFDALGLGPADDYVEYWVRRQYSMQFQTRSNARLISHAAELMRAARSRRSGRTPRTDDITAGAPLAGGGGRWCLHHLDAGASHTAAGPPA